MSLTGIEQFLIANPNSTQVFLFGTLLVTVWTAELFASAQTAGAKFHHTLTNAAFMSGALPAQLLMMLLCVAVANWTTVHHVGLVYLLPNPENPWIKYGLMFLALDFLDYAYHFIAHRTGLIWRLHLVHHSDRAVDVSTTFREHPGETVVRICFLMLWVLICGASLNVLVLRQTVQSMSNILQHTTFELPAGISRRLGWVLITPGLHHTHHHCRRPGTDCNYGDVFSIWDRLLGTYVYIPRETTEYGLDTHTTEASMKFSHLLGFDTVLGYFSRRKPG